MNVKLTPHEMYLAASVGMMRQVTNIRDGRQHKYGADPKEGWTVNIEGACGEAAVAKALGIYWNGALGNFKAKDVGAHQVRMTRHPGGHLLLHKEDADEDLFLLVTGFTGDYVIRGWIQCFEGKKEEYWKSEFGRPDRSCYWVPQEALNPMDTMEQE